MDCDSCQPTLLDLAEGQLAHAAAADARAHLRECASCRGAFDKLAAGLQLSQQLELVTPPQAVIARLHAMAEQKARATLAQRSARADATNGAWRSLLDFVSRFAMARQVGMVMISLLIVAVGLWSLPQLRHVPAVAGGTVVNPDTSGEAAPTTPGVQPAQRLDLKVDVRAGRIRSKDDEVQIARSAAAAAAEPARAEAAAAQTQASRERPAADPARALDDMDAVLEAEPPQQKASRAGSEIALEKKRAAPREAEPQAMAPAPAGAGLATLGRGSRSQAVEPSAFLGNQGPAVPSAPLSAPPLPLPASSPAPKASDEGTITAADSTSPARDRQPVPSLRAQLEAARISAKQNGCSSVLSSLARIVAAAPASVEAGEALIDMARCRRQLGDEVAARALLERAARIAPVSARANALLAAPTPPANPSRR